jgi:hypothetical protein
MLRLILASAAALAMASAAMAQSAVPAGADPATGARPGHVPGVGASLPMSNAASNITPSDTRSTIAPTLPTPGVADGEGPHAYLQAARDALSRGQTGLAQESLERAETRVLDRSVAPSRADEPAQGRLAGIIRDARMALGAGDRARAMSLIDQALAG